MEQIVLIVIVVKLYKLSGLHFDSRWSPVIRFPLLLCLVRLVFITVLQVARF